MTEVQLRKAWVGWTWRIVRKPAQTGLVPPGWTGTPWYSALTRRAALRRAFRAARPRPPEPEIEVIPVPCHDESPDPHALDH